MQYYLHPGLLNGDPFILVSSNDIFDSSAYSSLLREYINDKDSSAYITARRVQSYFQGGYLVIDKENKVKSIVEKPPQGKEPSEFINIVLHLHTKPDKLLDYLSHTSSASDDIYEKSLDRMINDGYKIKAVTYTGVWKTIKYPWNILNVMDHFSEQIKGHISSNSSISEKAVIDGNVIIEDNVKIFEGAVIRGSSHIGRNTVIGNGTLIRNSVIGDDCVVGYGTEIKHSYVGDGCWFHSNYIGDSILEGDCSFGAGAITANFRLDEANIKIKTGDNIIDTETDKLGAIVATGCRIGINASLLPGIKIGANTFIGSHVCLGENIEANKKVIAEPNYRILSNDTIRITNKKAALMKKLGGSNH